MSATRLLILGVVASRGRAHGYLINRDLEVCGAHEWATVKWGSIYHALKQLTREGKLAAHAPAPVQGERLGRTDYSITGAGRAELHGLIRAGLSRATPYPDLLAAALAFLPALPRGEAVQLLTARIAELEAGLPDDDSAVTGDHLDELFGMWRHAALSDIAWTRGLIGRLESDDRIVAQT